MNSHFKFFAAALLFLSIPFESSAVVTSCDYDYCRSDLKITNRVVTSLDDVEAAVFYLLVDKIPDRYRCSFEVVGRTKKFIVKYFLNRFLFHDSLDVVADLPNNQGSVSVITTDQALEVGLVMFDDIVDKKSGTTILADAGKTFLREKVVSALLWLLAQTNVEGLLPDSVANSLVYRETRNEIFRHFVHKLFIKKIFN
jgi:hypothetical protein